MLEHGRIKWFNQERGFGFLVLPDGREIFFHVFDGKPVDDDERDEPTFDFHRFAKIPKPGLDDIGREVVFHRVPGKSAGQFKAYPWCYKDVYDATVKAIAFRKSLETKNARRKWLQTVLDGFEVLFNPIFRCKEQKFAYGKPSETPKTVDGFYGNQRQFRAHYPLGNYAPSINPDPLITVKSKRTGVHIERWFEMQTADGWVKCGDPRQPEFKLPQPDENETEKWVAAQIEMNSLTNGSDAPENAVATAYDIATRQQARQLEANLRGLCRVCKETCEIVLEDGKWVLSMHDFAFDTCSGVGREPESVIPANL